MKFSVNIVTTTVLSAFMAFALVGASAVVHGFAQDGPEVVTEPPTVKNPIQTYKMERDSNSARGQEFIRLSMIPVVHMERITNTDGTTAVTQLSGTVTCYQRVAEISHITGDWSKELTGVETARVYLRNGSWYVVTDDVNEVWARLAEAGLYEFKPAKGEKE